MTKKPLEAQVVRVLSWQLLYGRSISTVGKP